MAIIPSFVIEWFNNNLYKSYCYVENNCILDSYTSTCDVYHCEYDQETENTKYYKMSPEWGENIQLPF